MGLLKKKLKVDSIHISTPLFSVGLRADNTQEIPTSHCRYDAVLGNILEIRNHVPDSASRGALHI